MKIDRLFEIVYILLDKKTVTAKYLADRFQVSTRTIYRDIDTLTLTGIPIYTNKGRGGGISILPEFVLNKSVLSEGEQNEIISALHSMNALNAIDADPVLNKLTSLFSKNNSSWIEVDFSRWGSDEKEREKFRTLKNAIIENSCIRFEYYNAKGETIQRTVEPIKIVFKSQSWYLHAFCREKQDFRMFKVTRIRELIVLDESFSREAPEITWSSPKYVSDEIELVMRIDGSMAYRLFDEFPPEFIEENEDGSYTLKATVADGGWLFSYVFSYGQHVEVLGPAKLRAEVATRLNEMNKKYS